MCGVTSETTSPSVRSTSRSTPCVLGCCGPMLTNISSVRTSNSTMRGSSRAVDMIEFQKRRAESGKPAFGLPHSALLAASHAMIFQRHLVVLAERVAFPIFWAKDAAQVGVPDKLYARQVEHFPLVPVGGAPHAGDAGHFGQFADGVVLPPRQYDLEHQRVLLGHARQVIDDFQVRL